MKVLLILTAWMQAAALLLMVLVVLRGRRSCPGCRTMIRSTLRWRTVRIWFR